MVTSRIYTLIEIPKLKFHDNTITIYTKVILFASMQGGFFNFLYVYLLTWGESSISLLDLPLASLSHQPHLF